MYILFPFLTLTISVSPQQHERTFIILHWFRTHFWYLFLVSNSVQICLFYNYKSFQVLSIDTKNKYRKSDVLNFHHEVARCLQVNITSPWKHPQTVNGSSYDYHHSLKKGQLCVIAGQKPVLVIMFKGEIKLRMTLHFFPSWSVPFACELLS